MYLYVGPSPNNFLQKQETAKNCDNKNSVHIIPRCIIQITYFRKKYTTLMRGKYQLYLMLAVRACSRGLPKFLIPTFASYPRVISVLPCTTEKCSIIYNVAKIQSPVKCKTLHYARFLTKCYLTDVTATHNVEAHYSKQFLVFVRNWHYNRIGSRVKKFRACRRPARK